MPDWTKPMQQTYEYYIVDPSSWRDISMLTNVKSATLNRDSTVETLGSASFDVTESVGEAYIRAYLVTIQNGVKEKFPLGTYLVQTPSSKFNGRIRSVTLDAYTPLVELKEDVPQIGYFEPGGTNIMDKAYELAAEHMRGPVIKATRYESNRFGDTKTELTGDLVASTDDTWLSFLNTLIGNADYKFDLDEMGNTLFSPRQETESLQPIWTFTDDNSSILYSDITMDHDLFGIPNVVEVIYSDGGEFHDVVVANDDENSPTSIQARGRRIVHREINPQFLASPSREEVEEYAKKVLKDMSTVEYTLTYTHGYCPVRTGDCVRIDYKRAGITNIKARVVSQSISCTPGCPVTEKAVFTNKLWR